MEKSQSFQQIPVIDMAPLLNENPSQEALEVTVDAIRNACKNVGFFYIENHGIPAEHFEKVFNVIHEFFALSVDEKMRIHMAKSDLYRGYTPLGKEVTNNQRDWNEAVDFGRDCSMDDCDEYSKEKLRGPNPWPGQPVKFKALLSQHWDLLVNIGTKITEGMAMSLGLDRNFFYPHIDQSDHMMRILHYPPFNEAIGENIGAGIGPHIDYGFLTILAQDKVGGLEVKNRNDEWVKAPYIPGTLIVNIGHMTQRWTNDEYKATMHQVKSKGDRHRYSFPFFFEPNFDTVITPLSQFCTPSNPSNYEPLHFGDHIKAKFEVSYADSLDVN